MALDTFGAMAAGRARWKDSTPAARSAAMRKVVQARWAKRQQPAPEPTVTLPEAIACIQSAIASRHGGSFYATPFDRLADWLTTE